MAVDYKDYYQILGVPKTATDKEIKAAYRKLARQFHPDVNAGDKSAEDRFKDVGEAYDVLSDPDKRSKYDMYGDQWKAASQAGGFHPGSGGAYEYDFSGMGQGGLDDLLQSIFGSAAAGGAGFSGFNRTAQRSTRSAQQDVETPVEITLEEAFAGVSKAFTLNVPSACGRCNGAGAVSVGKACQTCGGTGRLKGGRGFFGNNTCPECGGSGQALEICPECHGDGTVSNPKRLDVKIPAGVAEGQRVRLAGQGVNGGDLFLKVSILPHPKYERTGDDLYTDFDLPYTVAAIGGEASVETFHGRKVVTIPPGTASGKSFRLVGQGMPNLKQKGVSGNLIARARLTVPSDLSKKERELLIELAKIRKDNVKI